MRTAILAFILGIISVDWAWSQCEYANPSSTLGIGLLECNRYNNRIPVFEVYNDPGLTDKFCTWNIDDEIAPPFCAKFYKPDYGIVQIVVLDSLAKCYKILANEKDIKYAPRNINYVFWSWEKYLTQSHGTRRKPEKKHFQNQPIRTQPEESGQTIQFPEEQFELLCVMEFKGDWIKVKYDCFYNQDQNPNEGLPCSEYIKNCPNSPTGWLKWRIGNEIAVDIFLMP